MPAESTVRIVCWMGAVAGERASAFASTRVCGMWFRFIAFVCIQCWLPNVCGIFFFTSFYFPFIFHELKNTSSPTTKREKNISQNWIRTEHTKKMTSGLLYFVWLFSNWMPCVCINVCHMRVIKWAHGYSLGMWMCSFSLLFRLLFLTTRIRSIRFNERISHSLGSRLKCRLLLRLRAFYVCMPYNLCEMWNRLWNRFYSSNGL